MKKMMFNDKYGLTQAVLNGTKMQTRRLVKNGVPLGNYEEAMTHSTYKVGEVVAVAQRYSDVGAASFDEWERNSDWFKKGFSNKMFVKSELMPYHIKITDVRIERLQEISDEDCMREGIKFVGELRADGYNDYYFSCRPTPKHPDNNMIGYFTSPCEAYAVLIDKINGKGTWESNPYVFVYDFELVNSRGGGEHS